jgi:hypothetical protein
MLNSGEQNSTIIRARKPQMMSQLDLEVNDAADKATPKYKTRILGDFIPLNVIWYKTRPEKNLKFARHVV